MKARDKLVEVHELHPNSLGWNLYEENLREIHEKLIILTHSKDCQAYDDIPPMCCEGPNGKITTTHAIARYAADTIESGLTHRYFSYPNRDEVHTEGKLNRNEWRWKTLATLDEIRMVLDCNWCNMVHYPEFSPHSERLLIYKVAALIYKAQKLIDSVRVGTVNFDHYSNVR